MTSSTLKNVYVGKNNGAHRWSVPGLLLILVGMIALLGVSHFWRGGLKVRKLSVEGNHILSEEEILKLAAIPESIGLYELDLTVVETRIEKHSFVKEVMLVRELPSSVRIRVTERHPVAILAGPEPVFIDADLVVLPSIRSKEIFDLPVITGWRGQKSSETKVGSKGLALYDLQSRRPTTPYGTVGPLDQGLPRAVNIIETANRMDENLYHLISEVRLLDGDDIVLYSSDFGVPILFGHGDEVRKLVYLHEFWNQVVSREGAAKLQSVDLRFEGQIVARWNRQLENQSERKPGAI